MERGVVNCALSCRLMLQICLVSVLIWPASAQAVSPIHRRNSEPHGIPSNISETCEDYGQRVGCYFRPICFCDELCTKYNDCCFSENVVSNGRDSSHSVLVDHPGLLKHQVCVELPQALIHAIHGRSDVLVHNSYLLPNHFWMVGRCPQSWKNTAIRDLCEMPSADTEDLLLLLPVNVAGTTQDTAFRNIYCAVCHGIPFSKITSFQIMSSVSAVNATKSEEKVLVDLISSEAFNRKNIKFDFLSSGMRKCLGSLVNDCPVDYEDDHVIQGCRSNMTAVVHPLTHVVYRNWYCALCNNAIDSELRICGNVKLIPPPIFTTSMTAFIDFHGSKVLLGDANKTSMKVIGNKCRNNEFLDPFVLRCRPLLCPGELKPSGGRCAHPNSSHESLDIRDQNCSHPTQAELEVDICSEDGSLFNPCFLWEECSGEQTLKSSILAKGSCQMLERSYHELGCGTSARIRLAANVTPEDEDSLVGVLAGLDKNCSYGLSVAMVVIKRGCTPLDKTRCYDYRTENESNVYFASWNRSEALYLRDLNAVYPLTETLYRTKYNLNGSLSGIHTVSICGNPIAFNCSIDVLYSSRRLHKSPTDFLLDDNRIVLESIGEALVCNGLGLSPEIPLGLRDILVAVHIVTIVGLLVSILALITSFTTYLLFPSLRNLPGRCVMSLIVAVFMSQLLFLITGDSVARAIGEAGCVFLAAFVHFACLSMFSWTNILVYYLARTLGPGAKPSAASERRNNFLIFSVFGWGVPLAFVFLCFVLYAILGLGTAYGISVDPWGLLSCHITDRNVEIAMVVAPISLSLFVNIALYVKILLGFSSRRAASTRLHSNEAQWHHIRRDAVISIKIGFLLTLTWIFGFLATAFQSEALLFVFCILTSLQGVYIFLAFTFTQQVRALWRDKLGLGHSTSEPVANQKTAQRRYFRKPKGVVSSSTDKRGLSEHQTAVSARSDTAKDTDNV